MIGPRLRATMSEPDSPETSPTADEQLAAVLADPRARVRLVEALREELEARRPRRLFERLQPFAAGLVSGVVTVLAFFLPSLQDQWDRYQSRRVVSSYVAMGQAFLADGRYGVAEQAFAKALELSENKRLDIEELRLLARVQRIDADPAWGAKNPAGLKESDFLYLLQMQRAEKHRAERGATLTAYGAFLAGARRYSEAERAVREAIALDPTAAGPQVHLGNVLADRGDAAGAEAAYRTALRLDDKEAHAHYNLGLLLKEAHRIPEANAELEQATRLAPDEPDAWEQLAECLAAQGSRAEARSARERARRLGSAEAQGTAESDIESDEETAK